MEFIKKHKDIFILISLFITCYILFFYGMGNYPLIDVDETRYVSIAEAMLSNKDWLTLKLNTEFFFEKPPLFFWLANLSFLISGNINETAARIPTALFASFSVLSVYLFCKTLVSRKLGFISALIMATSFEFLVLSRIAILDMILASCIIMAVLLGFMTFFCEEKYKKYVWWGFYFISALAVLTKGLPGIIVPFGVLFFTYLLAGKIKEIFRPVYVLPGVILFFIVVLPWHIVMYNLHGDLFFHKYIIEHHFHRFVDSENIGRKEPFYFYAIVFAAGFLPWTLSFITMVIDTTKNFLNDVKLYFADFKYKNLSEKWDSLDKTKKFLGLNIIFFMFVFLFFSTASTKLPTYILPIYAPAGILLGYYWYEYIFENKYERKTFVTTTILNSLFILAAVAALFTPFFLSTEIQADINLFIVPTVLLFTIIPVISIFSVIFKAKKVTFATYILLMFGIITISVNHIFDFVCSFGESDLIEYSIQARTDKAKLATYTFGRRYSTVFYYDGYVDIQTEDNKEWLKNYIKKNPKAYIIVKLKNLESLDQNFTYEVVKTGRKYCLLKNLKAL